MAVDCKKCWSCEGVVKFRINDIRGVFVTFSVSDGTKLENIEVVKLLLIKYNAAPKTVK